MFAEVALPIPLRKTLTYRIPAVLEKKILSGSRVLVPVENRPSWGFVVSVSEKTDLNYTREIADIFEEFPLFSARILKLAEWVSDYYLSSKGEVLKIALPGEVDPRKRLQIFHHREQFSPDKKTTQASKPSLTSEQTTILEFLAKKKKINYLTLEQKVKSRNFFEQTNLLRKKEFLDWKLSSTFASEDSGLTSERFESCPIDFSLTTEQREAYLKIADYLDKAAFVVFLLFGVTGSGKTMVYLQVVDKVLKSGKQALILVPEISLTPQTTERFEKYFKDNVGVYHSALGSKEREKIWHRMKSGKLSVVIGARSAVFAPLDNLGIIIVDEEHDSSYKQQDSPRYNARDVAVMRGKIEKIPVVLGSATPGLESFYNAQTGKYILCELPGRYRQQNLPRVKIIDLATKEKLGSFITSALFSRLKEKISKGQQAILFLNRRGFAPLVKCEECGLVFKCPRCQITCTYHIKNFSLECHYCGYKTEAPRICPACRGNHLFYFGAGTQRIENQLKELFGATQVQRLDWDITRGKNKAQAILSDFKAEKFKILVGTQMVTKGLDFPEVNLVGVISADTILDLPDFRAKERTFQLLTQVAGRAGRRDVAGEVIIQTYYPRDPSISLATQHDFKGFYEKELPHRKALNYPPFKHLILILFVGPKRDLTEKAVKEFTLTLKTEVRNQNFDELEILGPAIAPLAMIKGKYRFQILLKTPRIVSATRFLGKFLDQKFPQKKLKSVRIVVDVDPASML